MTDVYSCSICWKDTVPVTMIAGTVICKDCLTKTVADKETGEQSLKGQMAEQIMKENDIYD